MESIHSNNAVIVFSLKNIQDAIDALSKKLYDDSWEQFLDSYNEECKLLEELHNYFQQKLAFLEYYRLCIIYIALRIICIEKVLSHVFNYISIRMRHIYLLRTQDRSDGTSSFANM